MIDSHTHLDQCEGGPAALVAAAAEAGVERLVTIGMDSETCRAALELSDRFDGVYAAIGRHPNKAAGFDAAVLDELRELAAHPRCVAIGETGLDYFRDYAPRDDQSAAFIAQSQLARETDKALVIHTRAAERDTLQTLREHATGLRVIMHCFSMPAQIDECVAEGWWISFAGNVTYPKADDLRWAAAHVPPGRLLVETDAPYLTPQSRRKERNQPAFVAETARVVAEARGETLEELERHVAEAAAEVFAW
jgi:TatD DNase family protein